MWQLSVKMSFSGKCMRISQETWHSCPEWEKMNQWPFALRTKEKFFVVRCAEGQMRNSFMFEVIFWNLFTLKKKKKPLKVKRNVLSQATLFSFLSLYQKREDCWIKCDLWPRKRGHPPLSPTTPNLFCKEQQKRVCRSSYFKAGLEKP